VKSRFVFNYEIVGRENVGTLSSCGVDEQIFIKHYLIPKIFNPFDEACEKSL
jgi:hypothetical protein